MKRLAGLFLFFLLTLLAGATAGVLSASAVEPSDTLKALQKTATDLYQAGSYSEALQAAENTLARTIEEYGPNSEQTSIQTFGVAYTAEAAGDLGEAERRYRQCVHIGETVYGPDSAGIATSLERLGDVLVAAGKPGEAEQVFTRELKIWRGLIGEHAITAGAYSGLGAVNLSRGDYSNALTYYRLAVQRLTSQTAGQALAKSVIEADIKRHREIFIGLARAAAGLRSQPGADQAMLMNESFIGGQRAWATAAAAALAKMTARLKAGETELGHAIRGLDTLNANILALNEKDMQALAARSKVQQADPAYREALAAFRAASISESKDNAPVVKRQKELIERLQALLARCPAGAHKNGCDQAENDRNAIAKELAVLSSEAMKGAVETQKLANSLRAADENLPGYRAFNDARSKRLADSERLEEDLAASRADIVKRFPDFLALSEPAPLTVSATQKLLGDGEALIAILTGRQSTFVWALTRDRADWVEIEAGEAALTAEVAALRLGLDPFAGDSGDASVQSPAYDLARAYRLYSLLLGHFTPLLSGKKHLLIVPAGPLSSLPFQVLVTKPPLTGVPEERALKQAQWLIRSHALSVLPSVQSLSALRKFEANGVAVKPFLGIGDPVIGRRPSGPGHGPGRGATPLTLAALYRNGSPDLRLLQTLAPLPETAGELRAVAKSLGASEDDILLGAAATKARLEAKPLNGYRILHFATHGLVAGDLNGVNEPALVLSLPPQAKKAEEGLLTASEVATLQLNADWVVLSACNTAAGDKAGADALSGLARAFFYAGARALLVSHWAVDSEAAVKLTTRTFAALAADPALSRAEAFRRAMLSAVDEGNPPSYWAPFIFAGEGGSGASSGSRH